MPRATTLAGGCSSVQGLQHVGGPPAKVVRLLIRQGGATPADETDAPARR